MSSGRGPPPRYTDRSDYDYGKTKRKSFHPSSGSRRDYKGPSSSSTGLSSLRDSVSSSSNVTNHRSRYPGQSYSGPPSSRGAYGLYGPSRGYSSYYPSYGSYNSFSSRRERDSSGGQVYGPRKPPSSASANGRYDSYLTDHGEKKWTGGYSSGRPRTRIRGSYLNTGSRLDSRGDYYRSGYSGSSYPGSAPGSSYNYRHVDRYSSLDRAENGYKSPSDSDSRPNTPSNSADRREASPEYDEDVRADVKAELEPSRTYSDNETPVSTDDEADDYEPPEPSLENEAINKDDSGMSEIHREAFETIRSGKISATPELESYEPEEPKTEKETEQEEELKPKPQELKPQELKPQELKPLHEPVTVPVSEPVSVSDPVLEQVVPFGPLDRIQTEYEALAKEFQRSGTAKKTVVDFRQLDFFDFNFQHFKLHRDELVRRLQSKTKETEAKKILLWKLYETQFKEFNAKRKYMDEQLQILHPEDDDFRRELESIDIRAKNDQQDVGAQGHAALSRRGRRHGDLVTTEAEFQEVLQSLEKQQNQDPLFKARKGAAKIPDMVLDPEERTLVKYMDSNNMVKSKTEWASRVKTDFINNFNSSEHIAFCEAFCLYPKRFGAISRHMGGLRTPEECVVHYYMTKKAVNYKLLVAQFKKKSIKKAARRGKPKSRNTSQSSTPVGTPTVERDVEEYAQTITLPSETFGEEMYTETGRRKRAAAPTFEGTKKKETTVIQIKKRKKKKDEGQRPESMDMDEAVQPEETPIEQPQPAPTNIETESHEPDNSNETDKKKNISSYWSITEANEFPRLLSMYGTNWIAIADSLSTKTATMVRNYFIRNAERNDWNVIVAGAETKEMKDLGASPEIASVKFQKQQQIARESQAVDQSHPLQSRPVPSSVNSSVPLNGIILPPVHERPTISSLLSNDPEREPPLAPKLENKETKLQRPSIMSLLNADSTSLKEEQPHERNDLRDLLNSAGPLE